MVLCWCVALVQAGCCHCIACNCAAWLIAVWYHPTRHLECVVSVNALSKRENESVCACDFRPWLLQELFAV